MSSAAVLVTPSRILSSAAVDVTAVLPIVSPVVVTVELNVAAPASLPSRVSMVISELASVPLKIMSVLFAAASIVILPEVVVILTAASPADISSAAGELPASAPTHLPSEELY